MLLWLLGALTLLGAPRVAAAQREAGPLESADRAYAEGALAEAGRAYEDALARGGLETEELVRLHTRLGVLAALGSEEARFEAHVNLALALAPGLAVPDGLDEAHRALFGALADARSGARLQVVLELSDDDAPIGVVVRGAPEGAVRTLRLRGAGWARTLAWDGERREVDPPRAARPIEARALDRDGNELARAGAFVPPAVEPSPSRVAVSAGEPVGGGDAPLIESPWLWIVVGVVAVGVAIGIGFGASGERFVLDAPVVR